MPIKMVEIENFRTYSRFKLTLSENLTLVIGENDAGKSSLFDAIRICCAKINLEVKDFKNPANKMRLALHHDNWSFRVEADLKEGEGKPVIKKSIKFSEKYLAKAKSSILAGSTDKETAREIKNWISLLVPQKKREELLTGALTETFFDETLNKPVDEFYPLVIDNKKIASTPSPFRVIHLSDGQFTDLPVFFKDFYFKDLKDGVWAAAIRDGDPSPHGAPNNAPATIGTEIQKFLQIFATKISQQVSSDTKIRERISQYLGENVSTIDLQIEDIDLDFKFNIGVSMTGNSGPVHYANRSDGIKKRLTLALLEAAGGAVFGKTSAQTDAITGEALFLLDEPDGSLHVKAQQQMFDLLTEIGTGHQNQMLVTTHSPFLVNRTPLSEIRLLRRLENKTETVEYVGDRLRNEFDEAMRALGIENTSLFFSKAVILVEGESDKELVSRVFKTYFGSSTDNCLLKIIPVHGCKNIAGFIEALAKVYGGNLFVVLDIDCTHTPTPVLTEAPVKEMESVNAKILKTFSRVYQTPPSSKHENIFHVGQFNEIEDEFPPQFLHDAWISYLVSEREIERANNQYARKFDPNMLPNWTVSNIQDLLDQSKTGSAKFSDTLKSLHANSNIPFDKIRFGTAIGRHIAITNIPPNLMLLLNRLEKEKIGQKTS